jgi:hypothetical protein
VTYAENAKGLGYPLTSKTDKNVDLVTGTVLENRRITTCEGANMLRILGSVQSIMKDDLNT